MSTEDEASVVKVQLDRGPSLVIRFSRVPRSVSEKLTSAEGEVVDAVARGATNAEIAEERGTATQTVANQLYRIYQKLGVSSRAELVELLTMG